MSTRTRQKTRSEEEYYDEFESNLDLDALSDEELEEILFEEEEQKTRGPLNLPTIAGLSMIVVGIAYLLQQLGVLGGLNLGALVSMLPWLAGILIILLGFGVLSWRPKKKKRKAAAIKREIRAEIASKTSADAPPQTKYKKTTSKDKKRLRKSMDKKIAGVCGGIADYFNLDPTLVRIAFVIGTIITQGTFLVAYILLAFIMSPPDGQSSSTSSSRSGVKSPKSLTEEERITIIRDS